MQWYPCTRPLKQGLFLLGFLLKKEPGQLCQEIHETWLKLLPIALTSIRPAPTGTFKLSPFEPICCRPFLGSSKILGCLDPIIGQHRVFYTHRIQGTGYKFGRVLIWCY